MSSLAPTTPIPTAPLRPAPPTERLPLPTVPEQIVELLTLRREWMTSSEIAQVLGLDLKVTQNALADLHRLRMVDRRKPTRNVPEKFEYAAHPPTHPSPSITISA